ncbi:hypothetical protein HDU83_004234, partial [Entophlyctis luteolus]
MNPDPPELPEVICINASANSVSESQSSVVIPELIARRSTGEYRVVPLSPRAYKYSLNGSVKQLLNISNEDKDENYVSADNYIEGSPAVNKGDTFTSNFSLPMQKQWDYNQSNDSFDALKRSSVTDRRISFATGRMSVASSKRPFQDKDQDKDKDTDKDIDTTSEKSFDSNFKKVPLAGNAVLMKAVGTIKANNTKKGLGWGEITLVTGTLQAILLGCLESYILWAVWKFINTSWGVS